MERRRFIRNTTTSLLAFSLAKTAYANIFSPGEIKKKTLVGAHVWPFAVGLPENDVSPILSQIFSDVAYAGFDGVELMHQALRSSVYTKQVSELIDQHKIILIGSSYSAAFWDKDKQNEIYEDVDLIFTNMASVGGKTFGVSVGETRGRLKTEEELDNQAYLLEKIIALGKTKKKGIVVNLHNHKYEVQNNMHDLRGTLKRIPDICLGPDLNWLLRADVDPIDFLKEFRQKIVYLHLRDQLSNGKWPESLGEGNVNFKEIADTLTEINFKGIVSVELAFERGIPLTRPIRESLKMSREHMRKTMNL